MLTAWGRAAAAYGSCCMRQQISELSLLWGEDGSCMFADRWFLECELRGQQPSLNLFLCAALTMGQLDSLADFSLTGSLAKKKTCKRISACKNQSAFCDAHQLTG